MIPIDIAVDEVPRKNKAMFQSTETQGSDVTLNGARFESQTCWSRQENQVWGYFIEKSWKQFHFIASKHP